MRLAALIPASFFQSCESTWIGHTIKETQWSFAVIETVHIIGIGVLLGSVFVIDLRMLGLGMKRQTAIRITRELRPWIWCALIVMVCTGIPLFLSEAVKLSTSAPFFWKMVLFSVALLLHFTLHSKAVSRNPADGTWLARTAACLSLLSWLGVALAGRAIAFL
jgi:uncharacterized protein DUF6644